jgi:hypothetical protein
MLLTKLKGIALVIGSSVAVISGAVALGQSPGPGGGARAQSDTERMTVMERKLDRIIDALDRLSGATSDQPAAPAGASPNRFGAVKYGDYAKSAPAASNPAHDDYDLSGRITTRRDPTAVDRSVNSKSSTLADRVDAMERAMQDVHNQMKQLAGRVIELERAGRGTQRPSDDVKRAE